MPDLILTKEAKHKIFERVLKALDQKFYKPELLGEEWRSNVEMQREAIESARNAEEFEQAVMNLLQTLKTSHLGFFHGTARRASSRAALSATYIADDTGEFGSRWIFQDVHARGAASIAGVEPGNILLEVNGKDIVPPEHPVFPMGDTSTLTIVGNDGNTNRVNVTVARPSGKKLHFVEPKLVLSKKLSANVGYLKVAMFPGMVGVKVANAMSQAISDLGSIKALIVDLRGNVGGGAGSLRLMSLLTPAKIPVGFAANRSWATRDLNSLKDKFPRFGKIPSSTHFLWALGLRYFPSMISKSPIVLETEGLGPRSYEGNIVLLVNRHTASAAEMVTIFAKENNLATIIGEPTAGRLLSANSIKVGNGFRLALPTGAYYTWKGTVLEGNPINPDVKVEFSWQNRRKGLDNQFNRATVLFDV